MGVIEYFVDVAKSIRQAVSPTTPLPVTLIGASGGGGPATIADGADVAQGVTTDVANFSTNAVPSTVIGALKAIVSSLQVKTATELTLQGQATDIGSIKNNTLNLSRCVDAPGLDPGQASSVQGTVGGIAVAVSAAALPLPTGAAKESGGNLDALVLDTADIEISTASIDTKTPALGPALSAAATPVVFASDMNAAKETGGNLAAMVTSLAALVAALPQAAGFVPRPELYQLGVP